MLLRNPDYIRARPILENIDEFDASFFGYSPREAELMTPQHRLFIESAWEALENAGYDSLKYNGSIGVFAGVKHEPLLFECLCRSGNRARPQRFRSWIGQ